MADFPTPLAPNTAIAENQSESHIEQVASPDQQAAVGEKQRLNQQDACHHDKRRSWPQQGCQQHRTSDMFA